MFKIGKLYFFTNEQRQIEKPTPIKKNNTIQQTNYQQKKRIKTIKSLHLTFLFFKNDFTQNNLQSIFQEKHMDFENFLILEAKEDLMSGSDNTVVLKEDIELLPLEKVPNVDFFFHESLTKMEQIMSFMDQLELPEAIKDPTKEQKGASLYKKGTTKKAHSEEYVVAKAQKKIRKTENSPFHNYQKHLNNALKKLVLVPSFEEDEEIYKKAARQIWQGYLNGEVKTKKILHFVFNEKNEHQIKESELKSYGLLNVYQQYGKEVISQAKSFLSKLAIDQIDSTSVQGYVKTRKMKKTQGFIDYVLNFRKELLSGYIKRRVHLLQKEN